MRHCEDQRRRPDRYARRGAPWQHCWARPLPPLGPRPEDEDEDEGTLPLELTHSELDERDDGFPDVELFSPKNEAPFPDLANEGIA